jgi:hypothetical protein
VRAGFQIPRSRLDDDLRLACSACETRAVGRQECELNFTNERLKGKCTASQPFEYTRSLHAGSLFTGTQAKHVTKRARARRLST